MRYYFVAGEKSGDIHGGNLMMCLKEQDRHAQFRGFGGNAMQEAGMHLTTHHRDMDFVGFIGLIAHLRTIYKKLKQCKEDILHYAPQVVILIDYGGFNMRIAQFCKSKKMRVFYYIPPKIWAWGRFRVRRLRASTDRVFCILPFEKAFYQQLDVEVDYVGNPTLDAVKKFQANTKFLKNNALVSTKPIVALLPGSRKSELKHIVPLFVQMALSYSEYQFVVATVRSVPFALYTPFSSCPNVTLVKDATYDALVNAQAAIVASGTATLETALLKVPQVVLYKAAPLEYLLARLLLRVRYISLVNLIANKLVVKELLQDQAREDTLSAELERLIEDTDYRQAMVKNYDQLRQTLDVGSASANAAALMVKHLRGQKY